MTVGEKGDDGGGTGSRIPISWPLPMLRLVASARHYGGGRFGGVERPQAEIPAELLDARAQVLVRVTLR
jgi:hypothetical protein